MKITKLIVCTAVLGVVVFFATTPAKADWDKESTEQIVWDTLRTEFTEVGAAAIMGNMQAESGLCPFRFESLSIDQSAKLNKIYKNNENKFVYSNYGYGLAGWSGIQNKQLLWDYCKDNGYSVDDPKAQCLFLIEDLKSRPSLCKYRLNLYEVVDLCTATEDFRQSYERSERNENSQYLRQWFAKNIFTKYSLSTDDAIIAACLPYDFDIVLKVEQLNKTIIERIRK